MAPFIIEFLFLATSAIFIYCFVLKVFYNGLSVKNNMFRYITIVSLASFASPIGTLFAISRLNLKEKIFYNIVTIWLIFYILVVI